MWLIRRLDEAHLPSTIRRAGAGAATCSVVIVTTVTCSVVILTTVTCSVVIVTSATCSALRIPNGV